MALRTRIRLPRWLRAGADPQPVREALFAAPKPAERPSGPHPRLSAGEAFTPTQPKPGRRQLTGRRVELDRIVQAVREDRAHVVLYSERGRGKTSLSNLVIELLRAGGMIVARHTCEADSTFDSVMRGLARDLPAALLATPLDPTDREGCEAAFAPGDVTPRDVTSLLARLTCRSLVCVIDEFDRIEHRATTTRFADTIKQISDRGVPITLMIVGVSENLETILGRHPSIQRNLVAVQLPLMTDAEISAMIARGGQQSGFVFSVDAIARVAMLARGNPYMAQLLGLRLTQAAAARDDTVVSRADYDSAVARMVQEASPQDVILYAALTANGRDGDMVSALRLLATAEQDQWGRLQAIPQEDGGVLVGTRRIAAPIWDRVRPADVLRCIADGSGLYVFQNRNLMHHVLLLAARTLADAVPPHDDLAHIVPVKPETKLHLLASRG